MPTVTVDFTRLSTWQETSGTWAYEVTSCASPSPALSVARGTGFKTREAMLVKARAQYRGRLLAEAGVQGEIVANIGRAA
jgi:hypothetical protein